MEESPTTGKVKFVYEKSDRYVDIFATGVYGGIAPHGALEAYLFEESRPHPISETFEVSSMQIKPIDTKIPQELRKIIKARVIIPMDNIPSIIAWLQDQYDNAQKAKEQLKAGE